MEDDSHIMEDDSMMNIHNQSITTNSHSGISQFNIDDSSDYNQGFTNEEIKEISNQNEAESIRSMNGVFLDEIFESEFEQLANISWNPNLYSPDEFNKSQILINNIIQNRNIAGESELRYFWGFYILKLSLIHSNII